MRFAEVLEALESSDLENKSELARSLRDHVASILRQKSSVNQRLSELIDALSVESTGEIEQDITAAKSKIDDLIRASGAKPDEGIIKERDELKAKAEAYEKEISALKRSTLLKNAAQKMGMNEAAFVKLAELQSLEFEEKDGAFKVKQGDKEVDLKDHLSESEDWKPFQSALFKPDESQESGDKSDSNANDKSESTVQQVRGGPGVKTDKKNPTKGYARKLVAATYNAHTGSNSTDKQ